MRNQSSRMAFFGALIAALAVPIVAARAFPNAASAGLMAERSVGRTGSAADALVEMSVMPQEGDSQHKPLAPSEPNQANIARFVSENWESEAVFSGRASPWRTFDPFSSSPGTNDEIKWGRRDCESTVGNWSLWSVGGGTVGAQFACGANYPSPLPNRPAGGIRTELQYLYLDLGQLPAVGGLRVTLDYKAKMPGQALFVGAGDFDNRSPDGSIPIRGRNDFTADTQGDWVRGHRIEVRDDGDFIITGKPRILFAMVYQDPPGTGGQGVPSSGNYGVSVDNIHLDAMFAANPGVIPSPPTPTGEPSHTPTVTPPPTHTQEDIFPTTRPTIRVKIQLPVALKLFEERFRTPIPTVPSATTTPTPLPPTATETLIPSPTWTAENTPIPTFTPIPYADVLFEFIAALGDPEIVRVKNYGSAPQDMTNWRVFGYFNTHECYFPNGLILLPGESFDFEYGRGSVARPGVKVCNATRIMWDNNLDHGQLWNERNERVDKLCFDRFGNIPCSD